jgi:microcystin degradation protein MlrC
MAHDFWALRERMQQPLTGLEESVALARRTNGTVILTDAADATSSGASGDSNAILRALLESGYAGRALVPIVDPGAVQDAIRAGVGVTVRTNLGGSLDPMRFAPLPVDARVRMLSDGDIVSESNGAVWRAGTSAVLQVGRHTVIATSRPVSLYDRSLFLAHGQDPRRFDAVVVKSPHCQPHMFADWAARVINVDAPGSTSANLKSLGHARCRRPIFPLDAAVSFRPHAEVYRRR